ncbi:MAG: agmatine deiminase family protein [Verrucomicrobia bacterium]|nr:agmatine deiminase family protein [Verrucomicrobiota bacterium]
MELTKQVSTPSEFGPQQGLWLVWSSDAAKKGMEYSVVILDIIKKLADRYPVKLLYSEEGEKEEILRQIKSSIQDCAKVELVHIQAATIWIRDTGPCFVRGLSGDIETRSFKFNEWGYGDPTQDDQNNLDYSLASRIGENLALKNGEVNMISEQGNRISDGMGTFILVKEVEMRRNPDKTEKEIEKILSESIGAKKVIWLPMGLIEDEMTTGKNLPNEKGISSYYTPLTPGGHIDEFCQFASEHTLLLAEVPETDEHPISKENASRLKRCFEILSSAKNCEGKNFKIVRVPTGPLMSNRFCPGDTFFDHFQSLEINPEDRDSDPHYPIILSTSYLNFLIFNDRVLVPQYGSSASSAKIKETDRLAMRILSQVFPSHTLIGIDPTNVNIAGGGLHCMTLNQPK